MGSFDTRNRESLEVGHLDAQMDHATRACLSLWAAVGASAIADAKTNLRRGYPDSWLENSPSRPSTFPFICGLFGLDPARIKAKIISDTPYIPPPPKMTVSEDARLNLLLEAAFGKGKRKKK